MRPGTGRADLDPGAAAQLRAPHRAATLPLYVATQLLAGLYTDDRLPARALRKLALSAGAHVSPLRRMVVEGPTAANGDRRQARTRAGR